MINLVKKIVFVLVCGITSLIAQNNSTYWQQHVDYTMDVNMDVNTYQYTCLLYTSPSPRDRG